MTHRRFRAAVRTGSGIWCLLIIAAPLLRLPAIYFFFSRICHQDPLRSWHLFGEPLAVCIRCTSIYCGFFLGALLSLPASATVLKIAVALTATEFIVARVLLDPAWLRTPTGLLLGAAAAPFVIIGIQQMLEMR